MVCGCVWFAVADCGVVTDDVWLYVVRLWYGVVWCGGGGLV